MRGIEVYDDITAIRIKEIFQAPSAGRQPFNYDSRCQPSKVGMNTDESDSSPPR